MSEIISIPINGPYPSGSGDPCTLSDHEWSVEISCGSASIICDNPCSDDEINAMSPVGTMPACFWVPDCIEFAYGALPVTLVFSSSPDWETGIHDDPQMDITERTSVVRS